MEIIDINDANVVQKVVSVLRKGGLVVYPTETAYGIGADATNELAISALLQYKKRPQGKSISVAVATKEMAQEYVDIGGSEHIFEQFLPGPITVVCKSKHKTDGRLESEKKTLGIRIPEYPLILDIIKTFGKPITATSANISNKKTPYSIADILKNISKKQKNLIDLIIDAGELPKNPTSTVVDVSSDKAKVFRQGAITIFKQQKKILDVISNSPEETISIAESFIKKNNREGNLFLLNGSLGAGKTHFVKGLALGLGIKEDITSPSYTYINEYDIEGGKKLFHMDAWRIENVSDLNLIFTPGIWDNFIAIEWPALIFDLNENLLKGRSGFAIDILYKTFLERKIIISKVLIE
jgi:L-threonylcarbamoyladenylate synthase